MSAMAAGVDRRPGLGLERLARLAVEAVERCELDLAGTAVLTEAATGPYVVTGVLAALAGADVVAVTRQTRYGTVEEVAAGTNALAEHLGVRHRVRVTSDRAPKLFGAADVVTNSGHLRPIVGPVADAIRPNAVIALMFEAWEIQAGRLDLDLDGLLCRGVQMAGTNERHPHVDVFSFLGPMAVAHLADAGVSAYGGTIAVLCDNPFSTFLQDGLSRAGAQVRVGERLEQVIAGPAPDAVVVALTPRARPVLSDADLAHIARSWPATLLAQFWGDLDREACELAGVPVWPPTPPVAGHMAVLPSRVGPEPIVRLQAGGLKVAQVLLKPPATRSPADLEYLDMLTDKTNRAAS